MNDAVIPYLLAAAALYLLLTVRFYWLLWHISRHTVLIMYYCFARKLGSIVVDELSQLWPRQQMFWEVWRWDFRHYVIHQGLLEEMEEWITGELKRTNLTAEEFMNTMNPAPTVLPPPLVSTPTETDTDTVKTDISTDKDSSD